MLQEGTELFEVIRKDIIVSHFAPCMNGKNISSPFSIISHVMVIYFKEILKLRDLIGW